SFGEARLGTARQGKARQGSARQGEAEQGQAWQGLAWHGKQNKTGEKSMETLEFRIIGEAALLMNNCRDAMNLFSPATIRRKELEKKRNRTDSEEDELSKIKYMQALYFTKES